MENGTRAAILLGTGDGGFGAPSFLAIPDGWQPSDIAVADLDQDGNPDFVACSQNSASLSLFKGNGNGTFGPRINLDLGGYYAHFVRTADLDGDAYPDLLFSDYYGVNILLNRADGSLGFDNLKRNWYANYAAAVGDLDGDGAPEIVITDHDENLLRVLDGVAPAKLAADDAATGVRHGYGRGFLTNGADLDHWSFSASRGQLLTVAVDTSGFPGASYLYWRVYDEAGNQLTEFGNFSANTQGQNLPVTIPRNGTYYLRAENYNGYLGEYRFRISLAPPGTQLESEDNNATGQSDSVTFALSGNQLSATVGGYLAGYDSLGDYFALGNFAAGTQVSVNLRLPSTSTLVPALALFKADGSQVIPNTLSPTQLVYTLQFGDDSTYHLRIRDVSGRGLLAEYFADLAISDVVAPSILADTLPVGSTSSMINAFTLTFNKDMLASTVNSPATYSLVWAGPDGGFASGDEVNFAITPTAYSAGLTNSYAIDNAPLQAGNYRFTVTPALRDKFGNILPLPYQHDFTITQPQGFSTESEPNNNAASATQLVLDSTIPGYLTGNGRGVLVSGGDIEYWKFSANAGDRLVFETDLPFEPPSYSLNYYLADPDGGAVFDRYIGRDSLEQFAPTLLTKTGTYLLRIDDYNSVRTEYRCRVSLLRGLGYEVENNDTIGTASPMTFAPVNGINTASTAGFVSTGGELDYLDLGTIGAGNTVFLTVRRPAGSTLGPIVSLYSEAGILQGEINGSPGDDSAEIQISTAGRYIALMRANFGTHGLNGDYVLDARILPTSSINFPNIRVTRLDEVTTPSLVTGDNIPLSYDVQNVGNLGTGGAGWVDRVVISPNAVYGDGNDLQLALIPRNGALAAGQSYTINQSLALPHGLPGTFYLMVKSDSGNAVDETLQEGDNVTITTHPFTVGLRPYPDLVIENVVVGAPDVSGNYTVNWNLANRGPAAVPAGQFTRVQVVNATSGQEIVNLNLAAASGLAQNQTLAQSHTFNAVTPGFYQVTISADATNVHYEFNVLGHGNAEQNAVQSNFQIFLYHQINIAASPAAGGTVTGGGQVRDGLQASVTAVANTSSLPYTFVNWTENGIFASGQTTYNFIANANRNLVAVFTLPQFLISAASSPPVGGSVTGAGTHALGATATLTANAAAGYLFNHWEENGSTISSTSPLVFTVSAARSVTAVFTESNPTHVVSLVTDPLNLAVVAGAATYNNGGILDTTAPASVIVGNTEYLFQRFNVNGVLLGTQNHLVKTFTTADPANIVYTAVYTSRPLKPFVQSVVSNLGATIPLATNTQFTVTFDRDMNLAVLANLALTSPDAAAVPAVPGGAWIDNRNWRSNPISFTAQNGGQHTLNVTLAADTNGRVMNPDASFNFTVDPLANFAPLVISPVGGTYLAAVDVTISSTTSGATIYYTTDGSQPDTNSQVYGGMFQIGADATVRAKAFKAGYHPSAVASAAYHIDAQPPVIGSFSWDGSAISNGVTFIRKGLFSVVATDNLGIASAEFYYQPSGAASRVLVGTDGNPSDGLTALWNVAAISDGPYTVVARVYDVSGAWSEISRTISVVLGLPTPPQITQPGNGVSVESPDIALQIEAQPDTNVRIFRDNVYLFAGYTSAAGVLNYTAPLPTGTSIFKAVAQNRAGSSADSNAVSVTRVREFPQLALAFDNNTASEGAMLTGTVTIPAIRVADLTVQIDISQASQFEALLPVNIPAGSASGTFALRPRQDSLIEVLTTVRVTAAAAEFQSTGVELFLADDDYPDITFELERTSVSEDHGALVATVRRAVATDRAPRVELTNTLPTRVAIPAFIEIPAGDTSRGFTITVTDNQAVDGNQIATLKGEVRASGTVVASTAPIALEVRDNEGPLLVIDLARPFLAEGAATTATVRRLGVDTSSALVVNLSQTPGGQLTLPATATIPAGQPSVQFAVSAAGVAGNQGSRTITLRATAAGYTDGLTPLNLSDLGLPELVVTSVSSPATVLTEQYAPISYRIENYGSQPAVGPYLERIFVSRDPSLSPDDTLVRQIDFTG